jgi:hypothetical protein
MVLGLKRCQGKGHLHFVTFCCYRREAHLEMTMARDLFEDALERIRTAPARKGRHGLNRSGQCIGSPTKFPSLVPLSESI